MSKMSKKPAMLKALKKSLGILMKACESVGITRQTHYNWLEADKEYRMAVHEIEENSLDISESMLMANVRKGREASIFFHLKCKGKKRGYIERHEIATHDEEGNNLGIWEIKVVNGGNESK